MMTPMTVVRPAPTIKAVCASRESAMRAGSPNSRIAAEVEPKMGQSPPKVWMKAMNRAGMCRGEKSEKIILVLGAMVGCDAGAR